MKNLLWLWKRKILYWWQRNTRGFSDDETWALCVTFAQYMLPRLKRFKKLHDCYPAELTHAEWNEALDDMILALEHHAQDSVLNCESGVIEEQANRGMQLFAKYYSYLWW